MNWLSGSSIHKAVREKSKVVDVDGSYLCHKKRQLIDFGVTVGRLPLPTLPITGWNSVTQGNVAQIASGKILCILYLMLSIIIGVMVLIKKFPSTYSRFCPLAVWKN